jgi:AraC-like DNA-binding protein
MLSDYGNTYCDASWEVNERMPPGFSRVYYVYAGEVVYNDAQRHDYCLKSEYLYIFPSALAYHMKHNPRNPLRCTYMHIDFFPSVVNDIVEIPISGIPALYHLLCSIRDSISARDKKMVPILADAFVTYCREHGYVSSPADQISRVLLYISAHLSEEISVERLSRLAGYNGQYFIRLFKQSVGITPYQYIIGHRLKEARNMLLEGKTITRIAELTGYNDVKTFSRAFKNRFGMSPSSYRAAYVSQP